MASNDLIPVTYVNSTASTSKSNKFIAKQRSEVFGLALNAASKGGLVKANAIRAACIAGASVSPTLSNSGDPKQSATAAAKSTILAATSNNATQLATSGSGVTNELQKFIDWQNAQSNNCGPGTVGDLWKGDSSSTTRLAQAQSMIDRENRRFAVLSRVGMDTSQLFPWAQFSSSNSVV